ncbi:pilin [Vibrio navarrensis]|uniref:Fimbrial protein n=1 Tax=Vibrio navarrensis TaxID=29495 RepID=A0A099LP93_9VIBR|nr:prepilin-type N-terminal cleavage/methylation domain-containing protein [Vibrio navarrensis]KGK09172.1 fimbrial protein [Vibrio navarrensis]MBE4613979.1 prepilin-type N-terminal cleavage/methylation domain-containing protein [Vibrio navarrensis]QOD70583.1 prepilin-type N-terminal cleavage/methylation domain-containing protein [Vibrio navarrensis]
MKQHNRVTKQQGFTLIELMIVVAIIGILAAFAVPAYQNYTNKTHASEMLNAASAMKAGVGVCLLSGGTDCSSGKPNVPAAQTFDKTTNDKFQIASNVKISEGGEIEGAVTATVDATVGKAGLAKGGTVKLIPKLTTAGVTWAVTCENLGSAEYCPKS